MEIYVLHSCKDAQLLGSSVATDTTYKAFFVSQYHLTVSPRGSAPVAALLTRRRQEVLGPGAPGAPGVRASRWDGDGVPDLDNGDWDLSICRESNQEM